MVNPTRRTVLRTACLSVAAPSILFASRPALAANFKLKCGHDVADSHPMHQRLAQAAERIKADSQGRLELQLFPNNQLGGDTDMLGQVRSGGLEMALLPELIIGTMVPVASITGIGFAFGGYDDVWKAMDGDLGQHIREAIGKVRLHVFDRVWDNGFRQITSNGKPILAPKDLQGFKIRVPSSQLWISMFKAFDAAPTALNSSELYAALQTKVVEGQENPLSNIYTQKTFEVQQYCSMTNHMWSGYWPLVNGRVWNSLPEDLQQMFSKHINEAAIDQRKDIESLNGQLEQVLTEKGLEFHRPELQPFRDELAKAGFYSEWRKKFGDESWSMLAKYAKGLG